MPHIKSLLLLPLVNSWRVVPGFDRLSYYISYSWTDFLRNWFSFEIRSNWSTAARASARNNTLSRSYAASSLLKPIHNLGFEQLWIFWPYSGDSILCQFISKSVNLPSWLKLFTISVHSIEKPVLNNQRFRIQNIHVLLIFPQVLH